MLINKKSAIKKEKYMNLNEKAIINECILGSNTIRAEIFDKVNSSDFLCERSRKIFETCKTLYLKNQDIDVVSLQNNLDDTYNLLLIELADSSIYIGSNLYMYIQQLKIEKTKTLLAKQLEDLHNTVNNKSLEEIQDTMSNLVSDIDSATQSLVMAEEYKKLSATHYLDIINKNLLRKKDKNELINTGFQKIDQAINGLGEGLYIIGAPPGLGKTSYILQMADNLAKRGHSIMYFSLEMSREELISKSLSRISFLNNMEGKPLTTKDILIGNTHQGFNTMSHVESWFNKYKEFSDNIFITEGVANMNVMDIRSKVKSHISHMKEKPIVFIDYMQILAPINKKGTDKQNIDNTIIELKRLSRDFKIPVIAVSSLNRAHYNVPIAMGAFKESGSIEFTADVLLGLEYSGVEFPGFSLDKASENNPREINLKVIKNRNGVSGNKINYLFYSSYNFFEEK